MIIKTIEIELLTGRKIFDATVEIMSNNFVKIVTHEQRIWYVPNSQIVLIKRE